MSAIGYGAFWSRSGVMFVKADAATIGPSESLPAIKAQGYGYVCFDPKTGQWEDERRIAAANGLDVVAWTRVRNWSDLDVLVQARKRWAAKAVIPNVEIPDTRSAGLMEKVALALSSVGRGAIISDGWLDPLGAWAPLGRWVKIPECFPEEDARYADVHGCVGHASSLGTRPAIPALGAYGTKWQGRLPVRADYAWPAGSPFLLFPGDTVTDWETWKP